MPTCQLIRITVEGFKSLRSIDLELGPITVLIGPNGSGKSNFVEVFSFLHAIRQGRLSEYVARAGGADTVLHFGPRVTELLSISARFEQGGTFENWYEISLTHALPNRLIPKAETACFWDKRSHPQRPYNQSLNPIGDEAGISQSPTSRVPGYITKYLDDCRIYHFDDTGNLSPLKETADLHDNRFLRPDGSNLAAFLHLLRQRHDDAYGLIVRTVQQVAPFFVDFDLGSAGVEP